MSDVPSTAPDEGTPAPDEGTPAPDEGTPAPARHRAHKVSIWSKLSLTGSRLVLLLGVVLVLVGGLVANTAQTAGGNIRVEHVRFLTQSGLVETGLLYIPSTATAKTPACGVVTIEGYINSVDTMDGFSIEMARRGCVVLDANQTGQGSSQPPSFADEFGGPAALAFINTLPIVRHGDVGLIGHSMGGWASVLAAYTQPKAYRSIVLVSSSVSTPGVEPVPGTPTFPRNVLVDEAQYSEFSQLMWAVPQGSDFPHSARMQTFFGTSQPIVQGKVYGSIAAGTGRELLIHGTDHPGLTIDPSAVTDAVHWMQLTLVGVSSMPPGHQIWYWDEIGTLIGLIGVGLFLFGVAGQLLKTSYFGAVVRDRPENRSMRGPLWWVGAAVLVALGPVTFYWLQEWGSNHLPAGPYLPQTITTGIAAWAVGGAIIATLLFLLWHFTTKKDRRGTLHTYGVTEPDGTVDRRLLWRSVVLGATVVVVTYIAVYFFDWAWSSDVRFFVFNIKPLDFVHMQIALDYLWPFLLYFIVLSIVVFGQLRPRMKTLGTFMLAVTALLVVGYVGFLGLEYGVLFATGQLLTSSQPLLTIVGDQFLPVFIIIGTVASYFFWKTGRIATGVVVLTLLIPAIMVASTATQGIPW
ncbi:MAG: alpha/beta hydrolase [Actinomycetota bacterium]|nr:alpha/beta hydrolase [Actinomycetota bacterium]